MYFKCTLSLFCIAEIISLLNQGFEFAYTLTFLIGEIESIASINLFKKFAISLIVEKVNSIFFSQIFDETFFEVFRGSKGI